MTRDDIISMARDAGWDSGLVMLVGNLEVFAALVAAHEREACADICKAKREALQKVGGRFEAIVAEWCEDRIRTRGKA